MLDSIRDFMVELSKVKWMGRLLQKGAIENSLKDFNNLLDESERSFQASHWSIKYSATSEVNPPACQLDRDTLYCWDSAKASGRAVCRLCGEATI